MALFRNVGEVTSIAPGATHFWQFWFGIGLDVGVALVTPNMQFEQLDTQLIAREFGVFQVSGVDEGGTRIRYTVQIHNNGPTWMDYNLNLGNLL